MTGTWRLCWGASPTLDAHWAVDAGSLFVRGPRDVAMAHACTLGWACTLQIYGEGLGSDNKVRGLQQASPCGLAVVDIFPSLPDAAAMAAYEAYVEAELAKEDS